MIFSPTPTPPGPDGLLAGLRALGGRGELAPELAPSEAGNPAWETLGIRLGSGGPTIVVEVERGEGPEAWLVGAEVARARQALDAAPAGPGRREALRRLARTRLLFGLHLVPAPPPDAAVWGDVARVATALARATEGLAWQPGGAFELDGQGLAAWETGTPPTA